MSSPHTSRRKTLEPHLPPPVKSAISAVALRGQSPSRPAFVCVSCSVDQIKAGRALQDAVVRLPRSPSQGRSVVAALRPSIFYMLCRRPRSSRPLPFGAPRERDSGEGLKRISAHPWPFSPRAYGSSASGRLLLPWLISRSSSRCTCFVAWLSAPTFATCSAVLRDLAWACGWMFAGHWRYPSGRLWIGVMSVVARLSRAAKLFEPSFRGSCRFGLMLSPSCDVWVPAGSRLEAARPVVGS